MHAVPTVVLLIGMVQVLQAGAPDPHELEVQAIARRSRIQQGVFEVTSSGWMRRDDAPTRREFGVDVKIVLDGKRLRGDIIRTDQPSVPPGERPREVKCYADDVHIYYNAGTDTSGNSITMNVIALDQFSNSITMRVVDPRALGLIPTSFANTVQYSLDQFVGTSEFKSIGIESETLGDLDCWKVTKVLLSGVTVRSWIVPGRDNAVVRVETQYESEGHTRVHSVQSELAYFEAIRAWYPTVCDHRIEVDGEVVESERSTIDVTGLNEPVDPAVFTIAGMDVPAGTGVNMMPAKLPGLLYWDGSEVVSSLQSPPPQPVEVGRIALISAASLSALIGAGCLWWLFSRKASPGSSSS